MESATLRGGAARAVFSFVARAVTPAVGLRVDETDKALVVLAELEVSWRLASRCKRHDTGSRAPARRDLSRAGTSGAPAGGR